MVGSTSAAAEYDANALEALAVGVPVTSDVWW
jgi:hypothetical protein